MQPNIRAAFGGNLASPEFKPLIFPLPMENEQWRELY
jgi:hypothetical protein